MEQFYKTKNNTNKTRKNKSQLMFKSFEKTFTKLPNNNDSEKSILMVLPKNQNKYVLY